MDAVMGGGKTGGDLGGAWPGERSPEVPVRAARAIGPRASKAQGCEGLKAIANYDILKNEPKRHFGRHGPRITGGTLARANTLIRQNEAKLW